MDILDRLTLSLHDALPISVTSYFLLPEVRYLETIKEIVASIFYFENWQLAVTGTDYLDQHNEQSPRSEEHTSELKSRGHLVCRHLLEKKKEKYVKLPVIIK